MSKLRSIVYGLCNSSIWDLMFRGDHVNGIGMMEYMDEFTELHVDSFIAGDIYDAVWQEDKHAIALGESGRGFGEAIYDTLQKES